MPVPFQRPRALLLLPVLAAVALGAGAGASSAMASPGALYTQTNDPAGNSVQRFDRGANGSLTPAGTYATGGTGLGAALGGRQGAVELSDDGRHVFAINAGSDSVSVFREKPHRLRLLGSVPSGGVAPVSVDEQDGRVYVLNSGGTPNVTAFARRGNGGLVEIGRSDLAPGASGAAQVSVTPDGGSLVVSERTARRLETLPLDHFGRPGTPVVTPSSGAVPFGFAISHEGTIVVSEAGASTVSSYRLGVGGTLGVISASLPVGQGAACWVAVSPSGRLAYTGNASGSISGYAVGGDGALSALDADGLTAVMPTARDLDFEPRGRFLLAIASGNATTGGQVASYRVADDGSLTLVDTAPAAAGITGAAAS